MNGSIRAALAALTLLSGMRAAPLHAQSAPPPKLVIYGSEKCPTDKDGNEIVVCERRSQSEQFRIPKEIREFQVTPENEAWASKVVAHDSVAATGIGSCSTVGPGGASGCLLKQMADDRKENKQRAADQRNIESNLP